MLYVVNPFWCMVFLKDVQEELPALLQIYERRGHFDEVLSLLEAGLSLERAHVCHKYNFLPYPNVTRRWGSSRSYRSYTANTGQPNVCQGPVIIVAALTLSTLVMEHLKLFVSRINIPKALSFKIPLRNIC
jgi:hypothetical protein